MRNFDGRRGIGDTVEGVNDITDYRRAAAAAVHRIIIIIIVMIVRRRPTAGLGYGDTEFWGPGRRSRSGGDEDRRVDRRARVRLENINIMLV